MSHQLRDLRRWIEALTAPGGEFRLACAHTGERPVPAANRRFDDRASAECAARLTRAYRDRLREWDPRTPYYDVTVHEHSSDADTPCGVVPASDPGRAGAYAGVDRIDSVRAPPGDSA